MPTLLFFALKNIKRKPLRTGILMFAIALLTSALVFSLSFVQRVNGSIKKTSERLGADILVVPTNARSAAEEVLLENKIKSFYMDRALLDRLRAVTGVDRVTEQIYLVTMSTMCCSVPEALVVPSTRTRTSSSSPGSGKSSTARWSGARRLPAKNRPSTSASASSRWTACCSGTFSASCPPWTRPERASTTRLHRMENMEAIYASGKAKNVPPGKVSVAFVKVKPGVDPATVAMEIENTIIEVDAMARKDIGKNSSRRSRTWRGSSR